MSSTNGQIPQSPALSEAITDSLSELYSRDPLGLSNQDLDRLIADLRLQRERWKAADATGPKAKSSGHGAKSRAVDSANFNPEDLGL